MDTDDNQIHIPPSFTALFSDRHGRLQAPPAQVRDRYELCEDLANQLVAHAQTLYHVQAPSEEEILRRMHAGLASSGSGVTAAEAVWVTCRLAELLEWRCPRLT